jgi:hypothetical protein
MVGLEVLDAASLLHPDLLAQAIRPDQELGMQQAILTGPPPTTAVMGALLIAADRRVSLSAAEEDGREPVYRGRQPRAASGPVSASAPPICASCSTRQKARVHNAETRQVSPP